MSRAARDAEGGDGDFSPHAPAGAQRDSDDDSAASLDLDAPAAPASGDAHASDAIASDHAHGDHAHGAVNGEENVSKKDGSRGSGSSANGGSGGGGDGTLSVTPDSPADSEWRARRGPLDVGDGGPWAGEDAAGALK